VALEIRPHRPEEAAAFARVGSICGGNYRSPIVVPEGGSVIAPEWTLCAFDDGELATAYAAYPFTMRLNGAPARVAGVTAVGTLPWHRRKGHLRKIIETDFRRRYEQQQEPISILLASIAGIYQRYGYAVASKRQRFRVDPRWIDFAPSLPPAAGRMREASKNELPLLKDLYKQFAAPRNLYLHRANVMWESRVLGISQVYEGFDDPGPALVAIYEEAGQPRGYVCYTPKWHAQYEDGAGPGQRVFVRDYAWLTPSAYRAMWEHVRTFDLAVRVEMFAAMDDPAFDVLLDPRELHATCSDHVLARIIDLERALPLRPYGREGRITFDVKDDLCAWNRGRWALEAGPDGTRFVRTNEAPQLSLDISAMALLMCGTLSATALLRAGRAEAAPGAPLDQWDAIWRTAYAPHCPDGF
jgi:predicted acetyltransferase